MSSPPALLPEQFHRLVHDAVGGFAPGHPPIEAMRHRAMRRRRVRLGAYTVAAAAVVVAAVAIPLALTGDGSANGLRLPSGPVASHRTHHHRQGTKNAKEVRQQELNEKRVHLAACHQYAQTHTFLAAETAVLDSSGAVTITGHQGYVTCGGPDDMQYNARKATLLYTVAPSATVREIHYGKNGPGSRLISPTALPGYLLQDLNGKFFRYAGPSTGILTLTELYHP